MRIAHIMFNGPYTENMTYQDNLLPAAHAQLGHEVVMIASCYTWHKNQVESVAPCDYIMADGVRLIRLPMNKVGGVSFLEQKVRCVPELFGCLQRIAPDWIMLHDPQMQSTKDVCRYVEQYRCGFVVDSHADVHNSGRNLLSRYVLHKLYYRHFMQMAAHYAQKIYYPSLETKQFMLEEYGVPEQKMEYLPLGGVILPESKYRQIRMARRAELALTPEDVLIVHSGKLAPGKKTVELLTAFLQVKNPRAHLAIIGSADDPIIQNALEEATNTDSRIHYLGWKSGDELQEYLCAADIYAQPGTQSATMQNAACCGCAEILYPYSSHKTLLGDAVLYVEDTVQLTQMLRDLVDDPELLRKKKQQVFQVACEKLDYCKQAERILNTGKTC